MFPGDHLLAGSSVAFLENPTPFPENADLFYDHLIPPPGFDQLLHLPPQKLRPIRSLTHYNSNSVGAPAHTINVCTSPDLGFMSESQLPFPDFQVHSPFPENGGADDILAALRQINPSEGVDFVISELKKQIPPLDSTSSSSEDSGESHSHEPDDEVTNPDVKNRNRKKRKRMESYLEDLMMQVINKQEQMHKQLIEMIEKREAERISREEAWRRQEIELANKEETIRAQEASRSLALISFLQNAMNGDDIQLPQPLQSEDEGEIQSQSKPYNKKWLKSEGQALIALRCAFDDRFRDVHSKNSFWGEISAGLSKMGYYRSARKCKEKWLSINKHFKSAFEKHKTRPDDAESCPYFQELEILYRNGFIN